MNTIGYFIFFIAFVTLARGNLVIKEIKGPESIENGTADSVILDCDFEVQDEKDIVLKWFYNGLVNQIYQWIPNGKVLSAGKFKNNIDVGYNVTNNPTTMYRALKIDNITPDMSGNYTCKVSTFDREVTMTKQLIIYAPSKTGLDLVISEIESQITCDADGIYPIPHIDISIIGNVTHNNTQENESFEFNEDTGLYNITRTLIFDNTTLFDTVTFVCNMSIPGTDYYEVKTLDHTIEEDAPEEFYESNIVQDYFYTEQIFFNTTEEMNSTAPESSAMSKLTKSSGIVLLISTLFFLLFK